MDIDIGKKIKEMRLGKGWSQYQLAQKADLSQGLISYLERNKVSPQIVTLRKIAQAFDRDLVIEFKSKS